MELDNQISDHGDTDPEEKLDNQISDHGDTDPEEKVDNQISDHGDTDTDDSNSYLPIRGSNTKEPSLHSGTGNEQNSWSLLTFSLFVMFGIASVTPFFMFVTATVKPRYNAGRGRKNFEAKNRVIARSAL